MSIVLCGQAEGNHTHHVWTLHNALNYPTQKAHKVGVSAQCARGAQKFGVLATIGNILAYHTTCKPYYTPTMLDDPGI